MNPDIAILEIRAGTGGAEADLWARDLLRMYLRYATLKGWQALPLDEEVLKIKGEGVFEKLKFEAGVHRVQRIPQTEKRGRIHTSTATVAVLPEIPESEIFIRAEDLEWDFFRASSHGGQNVQKVSSAVRVRHRPTGMVATCQTERDQWQNRQNALSLLRAKLWELEQEKKQEVLGEARSAIGRGMRAEKIRTYNFPQNRVTDHRIKKSWGNLDTVVDGNLNKIIEALLTRQGIPLTSDSF